MTTVLVVGAGGQVGFELTRGAWPAGWTVRGFARADLDVTDATATRAAVAAIAPDVVVNASAYTAVDRAESEPEKAFAVNRDAVATLAELCRARDVPLLHISTDYVFDGNKEGAYREDEPVAPLGVYGASKEAGEHALRRIWPRHLILRTAWVYGAHGHNFVKTMLRLGAERESLGIVDDQHGCPTAAADIAATLIDLARRMLEPAPPSGTYHYCGEGVTTWYGFATEIFRLSRALGGPAPQLRPISTAQYPLPARRPVNSWLDCGRIARELGIHPRPWRASLAPVVARLVGARREA